MRSKYDIPLVVLEFLNSLNKLQNKHIRRIDDDERLLCFEPSEENSDFFFYISKYVIKTSTPYYTFTMAPWSENNIGSNTYEALGQEIRDKYFKDWVNRISKYAEHEDPFRSIEDPILKHYTEEFYEDIKVVDADADTAPFSIKQLLLLDTQLEELKTDLKTYNHSNPNPAIPEILKDIEDLQETASVKTKNGVVRALARIKGKISKAGGKMIKEFLTEAKKEVFKRIAKGGVDDLIELATKMLDS